MTTQMSMVIQHLRSTFLLRDGADLTDGELLECFVSRRETAALEALVRRHGSLVWGVCLRSRVALAQQLGHKGIAFAQDLFNCPQSPEFNDELDGAASFFFSLDFQRSSPFFD